MVVMLVCRPFLGLPIIGFLRQKPSYFQGSLSFHWNVNILRTFRILLHLIVSLVSRAFLGFFFNGCYVSMSPIFRITYNWIFALETVLLLGISFISLERQYSAHFQDPPSFDCFVSSSRTFKISLDWNFGIFCTFRIVLHSFVTSVSRTYSAFSYINCYVCILLTLRILFHWIRALVFVVHMQNFF